MVTRPSRTPPPDAHLATRRELLDAAGMKSALERIAHQIVERNRGIDDVAIVGIRTGGLFLAERLVRILADRSAGKAPPLGALDITLYRDDVFEGLPRPEIGATDIPFELAGKVVVLVDDVLFTGRTVRAALDAMVDYGRPRAVQLAVLVDRGLRELPIQADYVGLQVPTNKQESVRVHLSERGEADHVTLRERTETP